MTLSEAGDSCNSREKGEGRFTLLPGSGPHSVSQVQDANSQDNLHKSRILQEAQKMQITSGAGYPWRASCLHLRTIYTCTPQPSKPRAGPSSKELNQMVDILVHSRAHFHVKATLYDQYVSLNARTTANRVSCPLSGWNAGTGINQRKSQFSFLISHCVGH